MMQKNETLLLRPWLLFHGALLGFQNLFVFDNASSPEVRAILWEFTVLGVKVDFSRAGPEDYPAKGAIAGQKIKELMATGRYDLVIPLDCDEFLAMATPAGPSYASNDLLHELDRIAGQRVIARTVSCYLNRPGYIDEFWLADHRKCIVPMTDFESIDHGSHAALPEPAGGYARTALCYIHMHHKPYPEFLAGVREKLRYEVDINDPVALGRRNYIGAHLAEYPSMTAAEYYAGGLRNQGPFFRYQGIAKFTQAMQGCAGFRAAWETGRPNGPRAPMLQHAALTATAAGREGAANELWAEHKKLTQSE